MNKKTGYACIALILLAAAGCRTYYGYYRTAGGPEDLIINIDAKTSTPENPVSVELGPGKYDINVIGRTDGGEYDAWKAWIHQPLKNSKGEYTIGWLNDYCYSSEEFAEVVCSDGIRYKTPLLALENALDSSFILEKSGKVSFYINDPMEFDNRGGISLLLRKDSDRGHD